MFNLFHRVSILYAARLIALADQKAGVAVENNFEMVRKFFEEGAAALELSLEQIRAATSGNPLNLIGLDTARTLVVRAFEPDDGENFQALPPSHYDGLDSKIDGAHETLDDHFASIRRPKILVEELRPHKNLIEQLPTREQIALFEYSFTLHP